MLDNSGISPYRVVIVTLDSHAAGPIDRASAKLVRDFPGLSVSIHASAEWSEHPELLDQAKQDVDQADLIISGLLFLDEHVQGILPNITARRAAADAVVGMISDETIVKIHPHGRFGHVKADFVCVEVSKETARANWQNIRPCPQQNEDAAPFAENPAVLAGQSTGFAGLVYVYAILAWRV